MVKKMDGFDYFWLYMILLSALTIIVARMRNGEREYSDIRRIKVKGWLRKVLYPVLRDGRSTIANMFECIYVEISWIVYLILIYGFDVKEIVAQAIWIIGLEESILIGVAVQEILDGVHEWTIVKMIGRICIGIIFLGCAVYLGVECWKIISCFVAISE